MLSCKLLRWLLLACTCSCVLFPATLCQENLDKVVTCYENGGCSSSRSSRISLRECCIPDSRTPLRSFRVDSGSELCRSCLVIGFEKSEYTLPERSLPYNLNIRVLSNKDSIRNYVIMSVKVKSGNATDTDYTISQQTVVVYPSRYQGSWSISIVPDQVVLEGVQTITLEIERIGGQVVAIFLPTTISIVDTDEFTDVACYSGVDCEAEPVQVASIQTCCQDLSALKSYKTVGHVDTCNPCLAVGFQNTLYQLQERNSSYEVSLEVLTPPASLKEPVSVRVQSISGTATGGSDFSVTDNILTLTPSSPRVNQTITIIQDGIVLENNETFALTLTHDGGQPAFKLRNATIVIVDTDDFTGVACYDGRLCGDTPAHLSTVRDCCERNTSVLKSYRTPDNPDTCTVCLVIGFSESHYSLRETTVPYQLTVEVLTPPESLVNSVGLVVSAIDGSALRGSDYSVVTGPSSLVTLTSTNQQATTDVTIIRDGIVLEEEETFSLQLQQTSGQQPVVALRNTTVTIVDGDSLTGVACYVGDTCGGTPQQLDSVSDCCLKNLSALRSYKTVSDQDTCVPCLVIGYDTKQYQLAEQSDPYQLTIRVLTPPDSLKSNVLVRVSAQSENATNGTDYSLAMGSYTQVMLTPTAQAVQHTLNVANDGVVLEERETVSLQLQWLSGQQVNDLHDATVTIVDTDVLQAVACYDGAQCSEASPPIVNSVEDCCLLNISTLKSYRTASNVDMCYPCLVIGFAQTKYLLQEQTSPHQLTVQVLSPPQSLIEDTGITFTATDGTAIRGSDYSVVTGPSSLVTLTSTNQQATTDVTIIRDGIVLEEEETFSLQLQQTSGQQPVIALRNTTVTITNGDVLTGVACYDSGVCGSTPDHLPTVGDCCLQNISMLRSYRSSNDDSVCTSCLVIGFSKEHYSMAEQTSPHQISIEVLSDPASLQTNVSMIVKAQSSNSTSGIDYSLPVTEITLTPTSPLVTIPLNIIDDNVVLEGVEVFTLQLERSSGQLVADVRDANIAIMDTDVLQAVACYGGAQCGGYSPPIVNSVEECCKDVSTLKSYRTASSVNTCYPCLVIGFNQTEYRLEEQSGPHQLTVQVLTPPQSLVDDVGVILTVSPGGSANRGSDYSVVTGPSSLVTLTSTNQQATTDVTIIRDGIVLEEEETFSLQLQQTSGQQPVIAFRNTTVTILDGDVLTGVACYDSGLCGGTPEHLPSVHSCCLENTSLLRTYQSANNHDQCISCLVIGFELDHYQLQEQTDSYQLMVRVVTPPGSLTSAVTLRVSVSQGNVTGPADYSLPTTSITLSPSNPQAIQPLSILTDGIVLEGLEVFSLQLDHVSGQPVTELHGTTVSIIDRDVLTGVACYAGATCSDTPNHLTTLDDCCLQNTSALMSYRSASDPDGCWPCLVLGFVQSQYQFKENANPHQLTVKVLSPPQSLIEDTGITFTATDGTAIRGSDYSVVTGPSSLVTLTSTNQQATTDVTIIRDGIVLEEEETFSLQLQQTSGQQPVIALRNTTVTILDGDVLTGVACYDAGVCGSTPVHLPTVADCCQRNLSALKSYRTAQAKDVCTVCLVIGFDAQLYRLDEQTSSQQLTISVLTPPASLTSSVTLQVTTQSGNASGPVDYSLPSNVVTLSSGDTQTSLTINILSDGVVLEGKEVFSLQLQRTSGQLTSNLIGAMVVINDRDDLTGVACYIGGSCENTPVHLPRSSDCCSQNVSTLKTYKTAADPSTCQLCLVLGFAQKQYQFKERSTPYSLAITVLSPPQSIVSNIGLIVTAVDGTAVGGKDYLAQTGRGRQKILSPSNRESSYSVTLVDDGIVLEKNETFSLQLQQISGQQPVAAFQDATVTITDGDVLTGVACYDSGVCGSTPDHLPTVGDCCLQNVTSLRSYRTASDHTTCATCLAIGFELEQYTLDEQTDAYQLMVKVLSPAASLHSNVTVQVTAVHANSTDADISLQGGSLTLTPGSPQATQLLTIVTDDVVLEGKEVLQLQLNLVSAGQPVARLTGTEVIIRDRDVFTGVACFSESACAGSGGVLMDSVAECCQDYSITKTYKTADNFDVCNVCLVVGFSQKEYQFDERPDPYNVVIQILSPPESLVQPVAVTVAVGPGNATRGIDYSVATDTPSQKVLSPQATSRSHPVTIRLDKVSFEQKETLTLALQQTAGPPVSLLVNTTIIITDHERRVDFRFSELSFNGSESSREVCATVLSIGLALIDIDLRITPMTLTEYTALRRSETNLPLIGSNLDPAEFDVSNQKRDFDRAEMRVTFDGTDSEKRICFQVFDDEINEKNEAFAAVLRLNSTLPDTAIVVLTPSHKATILKIIDDDYFYFGFKKDLYVFPEVSAQHMIPILPAPGNMTEQAFLMHIVQNGTLSFVAEDNNVVQRRDFRIPFPSQANGLTVQVTNDQLLDSKKVITFLIMPPMINNFGGFVKHQVTLVRIKEDEDFTAKLEVSSNIHENQILEACIVLMSPARTNLPATISLTHNSQTATFGSDYLVGVASYTAVFEPGANPRSQCFRYTILADNLAEGPETFGLEARQVGNGANVVFAKQRANVTIVDTNVLTIDFTASQFVTIFPGTKNVTFPYSISGNVQLARPIKLTFFTEDIPEAANRDYQSVRETVTFGPNKITHTSIVKILRTGRASGIPLLSVALSTENDYGISVNFVNGQFKNLLIWRGYIEQ